MSGDETRATTGDPAYERWLKASPKERRILVLEECALAAHRRAAEAVQYREIGLAQLHAAHERELRQRAEELAHAS